MRSRIDRPIVLLHGCGGSFSATFAATGWLDAIAAAGRRAVGLHLPGHGAIPSPHEPAHYSDLAGLVARDLPPVSFDAVGFSLGAKILLELALRSPARVERLVLGGVGDNVFAPETIAESVARALECGPSAETPPAVLAFLRTWEPDQNDALAVAAVLRRPPNPSFTPERIEQIAQPMFIVNGADDPVATLGDRLVSSLRNVSYAELPGVDHFGLPAQPAFIRRALDFLASASGQDATTRQKERAT